MIMYDYLLLYISVVCINVVAGLFFCLFVIIDDCDYCGYSHYLYFMIIDNY